MGWSGHELICLCERGSGSLLRSRREGRTGWRREGYTRRQSIERRSRGDRSAHGGKPSPGYGRCSSARAAQPRRGCPCGRRRGRRSGVSVETQTLEEARVQPLPRAVPEAPGLEVVSIGKSFAGRIVLRDVSLRLRRGEAVGLLGPNGAGKTTCFYIISGLLAPDAGYIALDGQDVTDLPMYRRARLGIGYLPQEASIFRGLTVEENIRSILEVAEKDRGRRRQRLEQLLEEFSITHLRRSPALALSGGERRRCEIARALAADPRFILLDEPLAGIDPIAVAEIRELVLHLKDRGIGVLITDHNVRETLDIVDRAYIIHDGRVLMEGRPDDIVSNKDVRRVYLGERFTR